MSRGTESGLALVARLAVVVAVLGFGAFVILSFATATTPEGTVCGNFWGGSDIGGCNSDVIIRRALEAWWLAVAMAVLANATRTALAVLRWRGKDG